MRSSLSLALANIFIDWFENNVFTKINMSKLWLRYIDDMFVIWQHGRDKFDQFISSLNGEYVNIKFTMEVEENKNVTFLSDGRNTFVGTSL